MIFLVLRSGYILFDSTLAVKIFLWACLLVLAVYLFILEGKVNILGFLRDGRRREVVRRTAARHQPSAASQVVVATVASTPVAASATPAAEPAPQAPIRPEPSDPDRGDPRELAHRQRQFDRIRSRYVRAKRKLGLLRILWIILTALTAILTFTL